ncbi:hypothetical protein FIU94_09145 [Sulfitobacter sp. THAF37]|uniref:hypothetical protein n=1 Tax=Sulfitobacter sp. THAF37 TaxID=2587855 RepID=UPI001267845F|nr:hypothetical protein [Sulfitobacter sp. THAF37]QFT58991.1 hypothetical protein FIU94_09145 [Sulfitobacter sp. THAF37]
MRIIGPLLALLLATTGAAAQDGWGNLDALLLSSLSNTGSMEASYWLPDSPDPAAAQVAIGVAYVHIPGSAGSVSIGSGIFRKGAAGWQMAAPVTGLFGHEPRAHQFQNGQVQLLTTMLGPGEPRCCPTQEAMWRIDLTTGQAERIY